jgi:hypothetical protein
MLFIKPDQYTQKIFRRVTRKSKCMINNISDIVTFFSLGLVTDTVFCQARGSERTRPPWSLASPSLEKVFDPPGRKNLLI